MQHQRSAETRKREATPILPSTFVHPLWIPCARPQPMPTQTSNPDQHPILLADWHVPEILLIGWPLRADTWRDRGGPAQTAVLRFVNLVLAHTSQTRICIVVDDKEAVVSSVSTRLHMQWERIPERVEIVRIGMNDCWLRDTGPVVMSCGVGVCFRFNAWGGENGGCYGDFEKDERVGEGICNAFGMNAVDGDMVMEGGGISGDGEGSLITTRECLLHENRNGGMSEEEIERRLMKTLGVKKVIWLDWGAAFDMDVDGHVDNMARFVGPGHVVLLWTNEEECKEQGRRSQKALEVLQESFDAKGRKLRVSKVSWGGDVVRSVEEAKGVERRAGVRERREGERICASYVNFVGVEEVVFVPKFGMKDKDERASRELGEVFREYDKSVVMVDAREFVISGGGMHCMTLGVG